MDVICRLCGVEMSPNLVKCTINDKNKNIEQKLVDCCRWSLYQNDENLPVNICISCFGCLEESWQFCEKVAATQKRLKEIFSDWKPDSPQPMNPDLPSVNIELNLKDEFLDDDDQSFEELPMYTRSEDEINDVNVSQIKVQPLYFESAGTNGSPTSSVHSELSHKAETIDEAIEDLEKLETDKIKFPQCIEPNERNPDGTVDSKAIARLKLCDWTIFQYQCHECEMIFTEYGELKRHYKRHHPLVNIRRKCWLCVDNRSYSKRNTLIRHIGRHHIYHLAFCCKYCNKHFWDSKLLKTHQNQRAKCRTQLKKTIESIICEHCGVKCTHLGNYRTHQYAKHLPNDLKTVYECYLCKITHDSRNKLRRHMISYHVGKKLVRCTICNLSMNKQSLSRHYKIHSDEMPFICSFSKPCGTPCGKAFKFSRSLEAHERIHTGDRPYKCRAEGCDYATSDGGNIYKHMKNKHKMVFPKK